MPLGLAKCIGRNRKTDRAAIRRMEDKSNNNSAAILWPLRDIRSYLWYRWLLRKKALLPVHV